MFGSRICDAICEELAEGTENENSMSSKIQCVFLSFLCAQQIASQILVPDTTLVILKGNRNHCYQVMCSDLRIYGDSYLSSLFNCSEQPYFVFSFLFLW